jgi:hypothetical protein
MRKLRLNGFVLAVTIASAMFFTWSCGGGSSGGGETPAPQPLTPAAMDQTTAETVTAMGMSLGDISEMSDSYVDSISRSADRASQTTMPLAAWVMEHIREGFLEGNVINEKNASRAGSGVENWACGDSGTHGISGTWTGPNEPSDICEVSDPTVTLSFSNCQEYGSAANGTITIHINGTLCAPTAVSLSFRGFSMTDSYSAMEVDAGNFDLAMTALQYSGDDLTHAYVTLNGDISVNAMSMKFSQFSEEVTSSGSSQTVSLSGSVSGGCLDGWVTFTTLSPVQANDYSECPVGGSVLLSGDMDMVVSFHSDGSLTIGDQDYTSCQDLPDICQ